MSRAWPDELAICVRRDAIDDGVPHAARGHDHALAAARQVVAPLAAIGRADCCRIEDRDVGGEARAAGARDP